MPTNTEVVTYRNGNRVLSIKTFHPETVFASVVRALDPFQRNSAASFVIAEIREVA